MKDETTGHILSSDGVQETKFVRNRKEWTNSETISLKTGDMLIIGPMKIAWGPVTIVGVDIDRTS